MNRILAGLLVGLYLVNVQVWGADNLDFNRDVRPILADKCYACHGPDQNQRQADLRLDVRETALADLGGYYAVVPGKPDQSELARRITAEDDEAMPPPDHPKQLSSAERQTLVEWIKQGAEWDVHWAYAPPQLIEPDEFLDNGRVRNFIDRYILSELQHRDLTLASEADHRTLIRRLSFDLIGLPPKTSEVAAFAQDHSDAAYEALVDRLLASPHFGERMAMYWLDLVRYADTVGYHGDQDVSVSPFRDYVIRAFNSNMRFDQFTREQLAGDLLEQPSLDQLVASGYNKLGMMSAEGGVQPEEYLVKYAADRVRTASTVWLGSTLGCAECHDHKFDPFTSKDFYRFSAFFADIKERGLYSGANRDGNWGPYVEVPDEELSELLKPIDDRLSQLKHKFERTSPELTQARRAWESAVIAATTKWSVVKPESATALHKTKLAIESDGTVLASGASPNQNTYTLQLALDRNISGLRIDVLPHESLPAQGPGRAGNGNFVLSELRIESVETEMPLKLKSAVATIEQDAGIENPYGKWSAASAIDLDVKGSSWGWAVLPEVGKTNSLLVEFESPVKPGEYKLTLEQNHTNPKHTLGHFQVAVTDLNPLPDLNKTVMLAESVKSALLIPEAERGEAEQQEVEQAFRAQADQLASLRKEIASQEKERAALVKQHTRTSLRTEAVEPREIRVLNRGNWMDKSGEVVAPGVPHFLSQIESSDRATRLDLANWIVDRENPLTARVFTNRLWALYFGAGLAKVLDDVGAQGESPSHPELLDRLAIEFVDSGWNIKHIVKLIVMSSAYRQSSLMRDELQELDPYNRLLARQSRFRLDAELVRDNALAVSGLLVKKLGGRSVKPYQPAGLYRHLNFPARVYKHDAGENQYRRGVYTHWQRQFLHPALQAMDAPPREECTAQRPRSNTPLAALVLLNDPSYVEAARRFAENIVGQGGESTQDRLNWMMMQALSRPPSDAEIDVFKGLLEHELASFGSNPSDAAALISVGLSKPSTEIPAEELAAWTMVARSVLNMHETVTRN